MYINITVFQHQGYPTLCSTIFPTSLYPTPLQGSIICGKNSLPEVASYQLSEDRAAMALAWNAPPDAVGADTVTLASNVSTSKVSAVQNAAAVVGCFYQNILVKSLFFF